MQLEVQKVYVYDAGDIEIELVHSESGVHWSFEISEEDLAKIRPYLRKGAVEEVSDLGDEPHDRW